MFKYLSDVKKFNAHLVRNVTFDVYGNQGQRHEITAPAGTAILVARDVQVDENIWVDIALIMKHKVEVDRSDYRLVS